MSAQLPIDGSRPAGPRALPDAKRPEDAAKRLRDRASALWDAGGCPSGREHELWAMAAGEIERDTIRPSYARRSVAR